MNWVLGAMVVAIVLIADLLAFIAYARVHPKDLLHPTRLQSKIESFTLSQMKVFAYYMVGVVVMNLLFGLALLIWAIVEIAKAL